VLPSSLPSPLPSAKPSFIPTRKPSVKPTVKPSPLPTNPPSTVSKGGYTTGYNCTSYSVTGSNTGKSKYVNCVLSNICPGAVLNIGDCSSTCSGDQYIQLYDGNILPNLQYLILIMTLYIYRNK
jgi:hypothetical protein